MGERSQCFYQNKVGLTRSPQTIKNHLLFDAGNGTTLLVYGRGGGNKADHTQARWQAAAYPKKGVWILSP